MSHSPSKPAMAPATPESTHAAPTVIKNTDAAVPMLVAQVYDAAPPTERTRLLA